MLTDPERQQFNEALEMLTYLEKVASLQPKPKLGEWDWPGIASRIRSFLNRVEKSK